MKPPMNNEAIVEIVDKSQKPNVNGKYPRIEVRSEARVRLTTRMVRNTDGDIMESNMEVVLPPHVNAMKGTKVKAKDQFGQWHEGLVITVEEATNFAGNYVYYRTVYCG